MKKICVITTTRADYGYFKPLLKHIESNPKLRLQIIATGTHLEKKYGYTLDEILNDGYNPDTCVSIICDDTKSGIIDTMSNATKKVGEALEKLLPDMVVLLGDRYETFSIASACVILGIPIAHISGGDVTYGAYDDIFRHCITKMSYLHFTSCEAYRQRVIQLGENPDRVFSVGSLSIENILNTELLSKEEIGKHLEFSLDNTLLATFHPITMESGSQKIQFDEILSAVEEQTRYKVIFTKPNADTNREELNSLLEDFAKKYPEKIKVVDSLGVLKYLSTMKYCSGVIGNSSSGIFEAPSFKKGTINIGNRQKGRICAESVINCDAKKDEILKSFDILASEDFQKKLLTVKNPYEGKNTAKIICEKIEETVSQNLDTKLFFDLKLDYNKF